MFVTTVGFGLQDMTVQHITTEIDSIRKDVKDRGFAVLTPPNFKELCELARQDYFSALKNTPLQPPKKPFKYTDLAAGPWRKLAIGSSNGIGEPYAQFLQTIYFDQFQSAYENLNKLFKFIITLRNQLMGVDIAFGDNPKTDGFWNACRVHHYPTGGGFMVIHRDTYFPVQLGEYSFYQLLVPLSSKGRDFTAGGGVVVDREGKKLNTDDAPGMGSVLIYDGRTLHGVEDVDADQIVSFDSPKGRLAVIANLYVTPKD
jgi:hypothetical protein